GLLGVRPTDCRRSDGRVGRRHRVSCNVPAASATGSRLAEPYHDAEKAGTAAATTRPAATRDSAAITAVLFEKVGHGSRSVGRVPQQEMDQPRLHRAKHFD